MARTVGIGIQDFSKIIEKNCFYIDKTMFIKEWWESEDEVTLITRPRRFGKTLTMSMTERFFSVKYAGQGELFEGLSIWKEVKYRNMQGTYPVISISFANVKDNNHTYAIKRICQILTMVYEQNRFLLESEISSKSEKEFYERITSNMTEFDAPMQEAYVNGYWDEMVPFIRNLFNSTFKTNPYLDRAILTGIICISKESIFQI